MSGETSMLYIGGSKASFRCQCGCNCFHHPEEGDEDLWECNACGEWYRSSGRKIYD